MTDIMIPLSLVSIGAVVLIAIVIAVIVFYKMVGRREKFAPQLIDLVQHEKDLLYSRERGDQNAAPLQPIPNLYPEWTSSELQAMRDNRRQAQKITDRIFPKP